MAKKKPLSQQVVVIGGGSYGLGRAIARAAAGRGARVVVGARTREALDGIMREVEAAGAQGLAVEADVADRPQVERLVAGAVERFGRIDTYIANGMVTVYAEAHRLEESELRRSGSSRNRFRRSTSPSRVRRPSSTAARSRSGSCPSAGERRSCCGGRSSPREPATWSCCATAGNNSTPASSSRRIPPTTSSMPSPGDPGAHGRFDDRSRESSAWTWLRLHGGKQALLGAGLAGAAAVWATIGARTAR